MIQISLRPALRSYLDDLVATGVYGDTPGDVARALVERGIQDALRDQLITATRKNEDEKGLPIAEPEDRGRERPLRTEALAAHHQKSGERLSHRSRSVAEKNNVAVIAVIEAVGPRTSSAEIAARTGLARQSVKRILNRLETDGRIRTQGWARSRMYYVGGGDVPQPPRNETVSVKPKGKRGRPRADEPRRRFEGRMDLEPEKVHGLPDGHPALTEERSLFPTTVIRATETPRVFVSGQNQRKLGDRVSKGPWKGMPIYALTLEERATCPTTCHHWNTCFGNGMPLARRHAHGFELESRIELEVDDLARSHSQGFVIRLHVLGDFYSADYVELWGRLLQYHPALHVFGYTAWTPDTEIGAAIARLRRSEPDRFAIRNSLPDVSAPQERHMAATTIWRVAQGRQAEGIVCPAQTHPSVCCGSCGLCWHPEMRSTPIAFIAHGRKSESAAIQDGSVSTVAAAPKTYVPHRKGGNPAGRTTDAWDSERIEQLRSLVSQGLTAKQIAHRMEKTRNAVISKIRSQGLKLHTPSRGGVKRVTGKVSPARKTETPASTAPELEMVRPPKQKSVKGRAPGEGLRRPPPPTPKPSTAWKLEKPDHADERGQIDAWLAKNGGSGRRFGAGTLLSQLQDAFGSVGKRIEYSPNHKRANAPYEVDGKRWISLEAAIKEADKIRAKQGREPIQARKQGRAA
ncbi:GcrA family cell cycle regulator [Thalassobaculum litoreum]|uniref:Winged helix-turn-helix DNA-binding n=1 Tax=Thalassobaculum litoreum DSM 18839 TaxID=1123362 RepID=A0A8G2BIK1_9PROT|nr:GcrA family cell cycle regulator [Thalassobaculum litoreum]SDF82889.1 Winged helix-turn-helix DNA-binding [Thalassobaculum litoreum DSM 18839]